MAATRYLTWPAAPKPATSHHGAAHRRRSWAHGCAGPDRTPRATQIARLVADRIPGLTARPGEEVGDYVPHVSGREEPPPEHAGAVTAFVRARPAAERDPGPAPARRARSSLTGPVAGTRDRRNAVITHAFLVGHLVAEALGAPPWRWVSQAPGHTAPTVIRYPPDASPRSWSSTTCPTCPNGCAGPGSPTTCAPDRPPNRMWRPHGLRVPATLDIQSQRHLLSI